MALAFKRAVTEAEKAVEAANKSIQEWYKTATNPALVFDYEGIKAVEGVSKQNPNSVEGPKNITLVNWVKDNCTRFHSVWGDVQYKDKKYALDILNKHLDKVIVHVDDKGVAGKYNSYNTEWKGKELHITVHIDFTNYPQQLNLTDEKNGHIDQQVWSHLEAVGNISYEVRKANMVNYESSPLNSHRKYLKEKLKKDIPMDVDWESLLALTGAESCEDGNKPPVPNCARAVSLLGDDGKGCYYAYYAIETLVKDQMGMEAFLETFDKVVLSIQPGVHEKFDTDPVIITKDGKTLKFAFKMAKIYLGNLRLDYSKMAKQIEAML